MDPRRRLFAFTLTFSVLLEVWVRYVMPITHGASGFSVWPPVDNVMHFFWGLNIFMAFVLFLRWKPAEAIFGVYFWQMVWEVTEMVGDIFMVQPGFMLDHFFFDGIKDTLVDLAGSALGWFILSQTKHPFAGTVKHPRLMAFARTHLFLMLLLLPVGAFLFFKNVASPDVLSIFWIVGAVPVALLWHTLRK